MKKHLQVNLTKMHLKSIQEPKSFFKLLSYIAILKMLTIWFRLAQKNLVKNLFI